jgi:putative transposase
MRKSKYPENPIVSILREGEADVPIAEILRKHGISCPTDHPWKQKYSATGVPELHRLNALERENAKLKRMYAEPALENTMPR